MKKRFVIHHAKTKAYLKEARSHVIWTSFLDEALKIKGPDLYAALDTLDQLGLRVNHDIKALVWTPAVETDEEGD